MNELILPYALSGGAAAIYYLLNQNKSEQTIKDLMQHIWLVGASGTGKTTLLYNKLLGYMKKGAVLFIVYKDQQTANDLLDLIPEEEAHRTIYINPMDDKFLINFDLFGDPQTKMERERSVDNVIQIFKNQFGEAIGPSSEDIFRMSALAIVNSGGPATFLEFYLTLTDEAYRTNLEIDDVITRDFFTNRLDKIAKRGALDAPLNKIRSFVSKEVVRNMLCYENPRFNLQKAIADKKIIICNFNQEKLGTITARLFSSTMFGNAQLCGFTRTDKSIPFFMVLDEFQNYIDSSNDSFENQLSMGRSFNTSFTLSHQYIDQVPRSVFQAIDNNCSTRYFFRVNSKKDVNYIKDYVSNFTAEQILKLPNHTAIAEILANGKKKDPEQIHTPPPPPNQGHREFIIENSRKLYGIPIQKIRRNIDNRLRAGRVTLPQVVSTNEGVII